MRITLEEAIAVYNKYHDLGLELNYLTDIYLKSGTETAGIIRRGSPFTLDQLQLLEKCQVKEINMVFNEKLYAYLINLFPYKYRVPNRALTFFELDRYLSAYQKLNVISGRKRYLISCEEVTLRSIDGKLETILEFGQDLFYEHWNQIKTKLNKHRKFNVRLSEHGIICFVDLRPGGDDYIKRFYRNSDLITLLVGRKSTDKMVVAPDFIGSEDVISVDDPNKLLSTYKESNAKLIILGDTLDDEYRNALLEVRSWDKFARFLMITNVDLTKKDDFIATVARSYEQDVWDWETL